MTTKLCGLSVLLLISACRGPAPSDGGITSPSNTTPRQAAIATTHFFGDTPDKTTVFGPVMSVVGPGVELRNFGATVFVNGQPTSGFVDVDFSATNILITLTRDQASGFFDTLRFSDAGATLRAFAGVRVHPATTYAGFTPSRVRVEPDSVDVNLQGLRGVRGQMISLELELTAESASAILRVFQP